VSSLQPNTTYQVTVTGGVRAANGMGVSGAPVVWSFTTGGATAQAPQVTLKTPRDGATGVPVTQVVMADFDQDMDASTLTAATFVMYLTTPVYASGLISRYAEVAAPLYAQLGATVPATVTYYPGERNAALAPLANLQAGATYGVTLNSGVRGQNGLSLAGAPVSWTFTTAGGAPGAPQLTDRVPASGATGVSITTTVMAQFDRAMDPATITGASFYLHKSAGGGVAATVYYDAVKLTAVLTPSAALEGGASYQVTLTTGVKGQNGVSLGGAPIVWTFTTGGSSGGTTSFSDVVPGVTPYAYAITMLASRGAISGFEDGTFRPNSPVTRQQFAKMIVKTLGLTVTGTEVCPFADVALQSGTDPFYPSRYVAVCAAHGITAGKTATTFAPTDGITRQQLITMVVRAAELPDPPAGWEPDPSFAVGQFSMNEHYLNARKAAYQKILYDLQGMGPGYNFLATATRGECAQLLSDLLGWSS
jgi:hypothetical protein